MQTWAVVVVAAATTLAGLTRELVALLRHRARRAHLENLVASAAHSLRLVDRDTDGSMIDITITRPTNAARTIPDGAVWPGE